MESGAPPLFDHVNQSQVYFSLFFPGIECSVSPSLLPERMRMFMIHFPFFKGPAMVSFFLSRDEAFLFFTAKRLLTFSLSL